jgi:hypothetical protein
MHVLHSSHSRLATLTGVTEARSVCVVQDDKRNGQWRDVIPLFGRMSTPFFSGYDIGAWGIPFYNSTSDHWNIKNVIASFWCARCRPCFKASHSLSSTSPSYGAQTTLRLPSEPAQPACITIIPKGKMVKLPLCFNWAPCHEGVLGEWRYSATHYWPRH